MNCPCCNIPLVMSERLGIEIDYCPQCRGIWLDRGELDKIIERSDSTENKNTSHSNQNPYDNHNQSAYYKPKKKSWMNELFD